MIAKAVKPKIEISLSDPAMTMLHRAGVAGLYMTLKALEKRYPTIALLYAPAACLYFIALKSRLYDVKTQYCLVIPEITDLKSYTRRRQKMSSWNYQQFLASGYSDAGFRLLTQQAALHTIQQINLKRCQIITFGQTKWTGFQKIRQNVEIVEITDKVIENYQLCDRTRS